MLKFVSTKPPKGKSDVHPDFHRQARGNFRVKAANQGADLRTFDGENSRDFDGREPHIVQHEIPGIDYDNLPGDDQQRNGVQIYGQNMHVQPEAFNTRSRTPSASSQESSRSLLRSYQSDLLGRRTGPYRHVTWSPDVTNGDKPQMGHPLADMQFRKRNGNSKDKKQRSFAKSGKKSLQGISRFLLGDSNKKNKQDSGDEIEMDNLHRDSVENSHAIISDYLKSVEKPAGSDQSARTSTNQVQDTSISTNQKKGSKYKSSETESKPKRSSPWSLHKVIHHFQTRKDNQGQGQPTEQRKLDLKGEKHEIDPGGEDYYDNQDTSGSGRGQFTSGRTEKIDVVHSPPKPSQSSKFVFSPIYSSTPKKKDMEKPKSVKNLSVNDEKRRYEGNAIPIASTWEQRPFSSDYEEIRTTDNSSLSQVTQNVIEQTSVPQSKSASGGNVSHDSDVTAKHSQSHFRKRKRTYPGLNLSPYRDASKFNIARPVPQHSRSAQHSQKEGVYSKIKHSPPLVASRDLEINTSSGQTRDGKVQKSKVMTSCVPQINHDMNKNETVRRYQVTREIPISGSQSQHSVMTTPLHEMIHRSHDHKMAEDQVEMDLVYITERLISMSFPSDEQEASYQYNLKGVMGMLRGKHGENVLILNFSEPRNDLQKENNQRVIDYGWPDHLAPPLERLCNICKSIDSWLNSDPSHVVVLHSKGGRGRLAVVIAAFMHYSSICASADQAMDRMAMKRYFDDKLSGYLYPSHKRYVQYFSGLLSGAIKINSHALYLHHLVIHGVPNFDTHGGCRPFIKVYQGMQPIFTSGVYNVTDQMQKVCISISPGIPLRGDIMIKCYHKRVKTGQREPIWRCQFHTCAISHYSLLFGKNELDDAINDPRFPGSGKVEFVFGANQDANVQVSDFKSDVTVPVDDNTDGLVRWDSYENFSHIDGVPSLDERKLNGIPSPGGSTRHQEAGPVDGSLYATVNKRKHENYTETTVIRNGGTNHFNDSYSPHASSDSGISGTSGVQGNTTTSPNSMSPPYGSYNTETRHYNTSQHSSNYNTSSSLPKQTVPPLDERTQLDNILSDLLNDQAYVSPKSGSNTLSKETRTFRTYETQKGPDGRLSHQTAEVTYKLPGEVKEERSYTMKTEKDMKSSYAPTSAFSYTPTSPELARRVDSPRTNTLPYRTDYDNRFHSECYSYNTLDNSRSDSDSSWLQQQQRKLRERKDSKDEKRTQQEKQLVEELRTAQNRYMTKRAQSEEEERNIMDTYKMNGPTSTSPSGYSYSMSRTQTSYSSDKSPSNLSSGDTSFDSKPIRPPTSPTQTRVTIHSSTTNSAPISPPIRSSSKDYMSRSRTTQQQGSQTFTRQNSDVTFDRKNQINPPVIRQITIATPPHTPRSFSPSYNTSTYIYNTRKTEGQVSPSVQRRTQSVDREQKFKSLEREKPHDSSYSQSSWKQTSTQSYNTGSLPRHEPTKTKVTEIHESNIPKGEKKSHYITEVYVHRGPQSEHTTGTLEHTRTQKSEKVENDSNRLDELERSLQAASNSIIATQQPSSWQQQKTTNQGFKQEHVVTRRVETRKYETHHQQQQQQQQQVVSYDGVRERSVSPEWDNFTASSHDTIQQPQPPPRQIRTVEEDRFSLRPIGPGVTPLEPEGGVSTGTLNRATTPSFPVSPVASAERLIQSVHEKVRRMSLGSMRDLSATPPFPVTPRTPYINNQASTPTLSPATSGTFKSMTSLPEGEGYSPASSTSTLGKYHTERKFRSDFSQPLPQEIAYNEMVSRQLSRQQSDPLYASIPENLGGNKTEAGSSRVVEVQRSPSQPQQPQQFSQQQQQQQEYRYEYQTQYNTSGQQQNQGQITQPIPLDSPPSGFGHQHGQISQPVPVAAPPSGFGQQQEYSTQQRQYTQRSYQQEGGGTLHVDTSPKMLSPGTASSTMTRSPSSPHSPDTLNSLRQQLNVAHNMSTGAVSPVSHSMTGQSSPSVYFGLSRRGSISSLAESVDATHTTPRFVKDTSKYWYKPHISREEAIAVLKDKPPGTFIVRDSNSFPGAFGLALKVATLPPNVQTKSTGDPAADLVRHFLIEPTPKGVRLRGCSNEPVFGSLASLVYQHSITPLALPCKLALPDIDQSVEVSTMDSSMTSELPSSAAALLAQGAACNVLYLHSIDTESLTGPQAVSKAIKLTLDQAQHVKQTVVHFKVSNQGITLTDNQRKLFFRRHYAVSAVTYCGMDPEGRKWLRPSDVPGVNVEARIFGFVARKQGGVSDNACHLFAELDPEQPASAIVNFVTKIMIGQGKVKP